MRFGEVKVEGVRVHMRTNMEMSALLKSEDSTFLPSHSHSVKSSGTEQNLCQPVNRPTVKAIYFTCTAHRTLAQIQGGKVLRVSITEKKKSKKLSPRC